MSEIPGSRSYMPRDATTERAKFDRAKAYVRREDERSAYREERDSRGEV